MNEEINKINDKIFKLKQIVLKEALNLQSVAILLEETHKELKKIDYKSHVKNTRYIEMKEFIEKYSKWFPYCEKEKLKKQMKQDLGIIEGTSEKPVNDIKHNISDPLPSEEETYDEMERLFNLPKTDDNHMKTNDTQIGWEECEKFMRKNCR